MAKKIKISQLEEAKSLDGLWIFGKGPGATNLRASMSLLRGNTAFYEWQQKNPGKTYEDYIKMLQEPAVIAAAAAYEAEKKVLQTDSAVSTAESGRVDAEKKRVTEEEKRVATENERVASENKREGAEKVRSDKEGERISEEKKRVEEEKARKASEEERVKNEQERITEEGKRKDSERARNTAETVRVENEEKRKAQELIREQDEIIRGQSEKKRDETEKERNEAEKLRIASEKERETAEKKRQADTSKAIENTAKAIDEANLATWGAEQSAGEANTARDNANAATKEAQIATAETLVVKGATEQVRIDTLSVKEATEQVKGEALAAKEEVERVKTETEEVKEATDKVRKETQAVKEATEQVRIDTLSIKEATERVKEEASLAISDTKAATGRANDAAVISEELNAHQPIQQADSEGNLTWWVWDLENSEYTDTSLPARGPQGKPLIVLDNGNYGFWDDNIEDYIDSGILAAAMVDFTKYPVEFTEATERENINSGEILPTILGKVKKWFSSLKALAFKDKVDYNTDIENIPSTFTPATHTHTKAQVTDFPASLKNPSALTLSLNGTSQGAYDGSAAKSIDITPASIGAVNKGGDTMTGNLTVPNLIKTGSSNSYVLLGGGSHLALNKLGQQISAPGDDSIAGLSQWFSVFPVDATAIGSYNTYSTVATIGVGNTRAFQLMNEKGTNKLFFRSANQTAFTGWIQLAGTNDNIASATKLATARQINGANFDGTANITFGSLYPLGIPSNADLNTYTQPGMYYCSANATVATLTNSPTTNAFSLLVEKHAGTKQTLTEYMAAGIPKTYSRNYYNGAWLAWYRVFTTIDAPTTISGNAASASKWATARTLALTGAVTGSVSVDGSANVSLTTAVNHTHNYAGSASAGGAANTIALNPSGLSAATYGSYGGIVQDSTTGPVSGSWYNKIKILHSNTSGYYTELAQSFTGTEGIYHRRNVAGVISAWKTVLDSNNYNSYAPTKAGTGASGTWAIAISGNAATASKVTNALTLQFNGTSQTTYDGSATRTYNITPAAIGAAASSHTHSYLPLSGGTLTGRLINSTSNPGSWVSGMTTALMDFTAVQSQSSYHPYIRVKNYLGHVANIGGLGNNFGFFGYYNGRTDNGTDWQSYVDMSNGNWTHSKVFTAAQVRRSGSSDSYLLLGGGGHKAVSDFSLKVVQKTATLATGTWTGSGPYSYVLSDSAVTANSFVTLWPAEASRQVAKAADIFEDVTTGAGTITIKATNKPTANISIKYTIEN